MAAEAAAPAVEAVLLPQVSDSCKAGEGAPGAGLDLGMSVEHLSSCRACLCEPTFSHIQCCG